MTNPGTMTNPRTWTAEILFTDDRGTTHAHVALHTNGARGFEGAGSALSDPGDVLVPLRGDTLAAERALLDLAQHMRVAREERGSFAAAWPER